MTTEIIEKLLQPENPLAPVDLPDLPEILQKAVSKAGWDELKPVQRYTIPYVLAGRELMVQSRTGSGKTGAFVLPMLTLLDPKQLHCQALVLVPTRELARQVADQAEMLGSVAGLRTAAVYGGVGYGAQLEAFRRGAHIVVGTPGRVLDHLLKESLSLEHLRLLVFDEADRMLSMGFYPDMKRVQGFLPRHDVNTSMFSATFPAEVVRLAGQFMRQPQLLSLSRDHVQVTDTDHFYYLVPGMEKDRCLVRIIEMENPRSAIIFCNTKDNVNYVATVLQRFGYNANLLTADLSQRARERMMAELREGKLRFMVATDLAARGIDIPELSHVIQYEPPEDHELYIHRAGRTGRAGASGLAITLVNMSEESRLKRIASYYQFEIEKRPTPTDEDVAAVVTERLVALLEADLRNRDNVQRERLGRFIALARSLGESADESAVVAMLLDDYYQKSLHAPPEQPYEEEQTASPKAKQHRSSRPRRSSPGGRRGGSRRRH